MRSRPAAAMAELVYLLLLCTAGTLVRPSTAQSSGASGELLTDGVRGIRWA